LRLGSKMYRNADLAAPGVSRQAAWSRYSRPCAVTTKAPDERLLLAVMRVLVNHTFRSREANKWATELVSEARSDGLSWESIARELGVRRQTAWERYRVVEKSVSSARLPNEPNLINDVHGARISPTSEQAAP